LLTNPAVDSTLGAADTTKTSRKLFNNQTYWWRVSARNAAGWGSFSAVRKFRIVITSVHARDEVPSEFRLSQNYPNPFNPATEIRFALPKANHVVVKIFNTLGEEIRTLVDAPYESGYHSVRWDGKDKNGNPVASGIYLYHLQAGIFSQVKKMSLLH
jgi:hypothetical protein